MTPTPIGGGVLTLGFQMSDTNPKTETPKVSSVSYFVNKSEIDTYNSSATAADRDSSPIGVFITAIQALTNGTLKSIDVGMRYDTAIAAPATSLAAYEFDKFLLSSRDNVTTDPVKTSIPARKMSAVTLESNGITLVNTGAAATYRTAYTAIVVSGDDNPVTPQRMIVSS